MSNKNWMRTFGLLGALALGGCSAVGPSFNEMTKAYTASIEQHTRDTILINMMRAAYDMPLTFTDIPSVLGTGTINTMAGASATIYSASPVSVPGFFSAGPESGYTFGGQLSTSRQFNFTLSSLDNQQFTKGFLTTIPLDNVHFFSRSNHLSKELLYTLLIDSIEIKERGQPAKTLLNNPNTEDYPQFQQLLYTLLDAGLTTEAVRLEKPIGPRFSEEQATKMIGEVGKLMMDAGRLTGASIDIKPSTVGGRTFYQLHAAKSETRFCMAPPNQNPAITTRFGPHILCSPQTGLSGGPAVKSAVVGSAKGPDPTVEMMSINLRSTRDVFRFVGQVIMAQTTRTPPLTVTIRTQTTAKQFEDIPLLVVNRNTSAPADQTIASVVYFGAQYSVPLRDNGYSSVVFDLLSLLVTLNKIPGSIPASPGILIK